MDLLCAPAFFSLSAQVRFVVGSPFPSAAMAAASVLAAASGASAADSSGDEEPDFADVLNRDWRQWRAIHPVRACAPAAESENVWWWVGRLTLEVSSEYGLQSCIQVLYFDSLVIVF